MVQYLSSNYYKLSYEIKKFSFASHYAIVKFYSSKKGYILHEDEDGYYFLCDDIKFCFDDEMNEYLKSINVEGIPDELEKELKEVFKF